MRRSTDSVTANFFADANGNLGTALGATGTTYSTWKGAATTYVVTWYDQSGNNNMIQSVTTAQPIYNIINGFGTLSFDGINSYLNTSAYTATLNTQSFTIIYSATNLNSGSFGTIISSRYPTGANLRGYSIYKVDTNTWYLQFGKNSTPWGDLFTDISATIGTRYIAAFNQSNSTNIISSNIQNVSTQVVSNNSVNSADYTPSPDTINTRIGAGVTESSARYFFNGYINDLFYFGTSISSAQQTNVSNLLYTAPPNNINAPNFVQVASTVTSTRYYGVAISDTGKYILSAVAVTAGQSTSALLYLSTNFGSTFNAVTGFSTLQNYPCAMSGTGQYMVVLVYGGYMYRSGDYGANWVQVTNISSEVWISVALSKDGKYCIANATPPTNNLYVSANFDTATPTFTQVSVYAPLNTSPYYNAVSSNGQKMIQMNFNTADGIAISTNYGSSFTKLTVANIGITGTNNYNFSCVTMTPDTTNVYIACSSNGLYKSTNLFLGSPTFTKITSATFTEQTWNSIVVSSDGTYVVASTDAKTYYSKDSGATWHLAYTGRIKFMAMSADARYIVATNGDNSSKLILSSI